MLSPMMNIRLPASGDVNMDYRPWTNWGEASPDAGSPKIEEEIFRNVALPGKQLGRLIDAVNALIEIATSDHPDLREQPRSEFTDFQSMADKIITKKKDLQNTMKSQAEQALEQLKTADREAFDSLLDQFQQQRGAT